MLFLLRKIKYFLLDGSLNLTPIAFLLASIIALIIILPYSLKYNLHEISIPLISIHSFILFYTIVVTYKDYKSSIRYRMGLYKNKKTYNSYSQYLEENNIGNLSGLMEYECYSDYQNTKLFYEDGFIIGKFTKRYAVDLSKINTPELIKTHALTLSKAIKNESDTDNEYLKKRFINIAAAFHCIPIKRLYQ